MNQKLFKTIPTALLTLIMLFSAGMYFFNHEVAKAAFINLGFPTFLIYPLAVAKILGLIAIWTNTSQSLKEWAYAGFFFNLVIAVSAHIVAKDGEFAPALMALVFLLASYYFDKKHY